MSIFEEQFDINTMQRAGIIIDHFFLHKTQKHAVLHCWNQKGWSLVFGMLKMFSIPENLAPLNLIAGYYGEKVGFYFAFLVHHIGWLLVLALPGLALQVY